MVPKFQRIPEQTEYTYGCINRPPFCACPREGIISTNDKDRDNWLRRHGTITYNRPLTMQEVYSYELYPIDDPEYLNDIINQLIGDIGDDYIEEYKKPENQEYIDGLKDNIHHKPYAMSDWEKIKKLLFGL